MIAREGDPAPGTTDDTVFVNPRGRAINAADKLALNPTGEPTNDIKSPMAPKIKPIVFKSTFMTSPITGIVGVSSELSMLAPAPSAPE